MELYGDDEEPCGCKNCCLLEVSGEATISVESSLRPLDVPTARESSTPFAASGRLILSIINVPIVLRASRSLSPAKSPEYHMAMRICCGLNLIQRVQISDFLYYAIYLIFCHIKVSRCKYVFCDMNL
jgi:hypothetical protein